MKPAVLEVPTVVGNDVSVAWPEPDPSILRQGRRTAPAFTFDALGEFWAAWVRDTSEGTGAPADYTAAALLAAASSLIAGTREVMPWPAGEWREPAIFWVGVVGDPSSGKSPAADPVMRALRTVERDLAEGMDEKRREWIALDAAAKTRRSDWDAAVKAAVGEGEPPPPLPENAEAPPKPNPPRLVVNDATVERLVAILAENKRGMLHARDELAGWLGNLGRYSAGKGDGDRSFWIEAFGGRAYVMDRVKDGGTSVRVDRLAVSMFGSIQPERFARTMLADADDGLASRFLWSWPERRPPHRPTRFTDRASLVSALHRLRRLAPSMDGGPVALMLSDEASVVFETWWKRHAEVADAAGGMLASAFGKAPGHVLRLALIFELLDWSASPGTPEPDAVGVDAVLRAINMVDAYWLPMAERVYGDAALPQAERGAATIARWLLRGPSRAAINARALRRNERLPGLRSAEDVKAALLVMVEAGWLAAPELKGAAHRPREDYRINPRVWELGS